MRLYLLSITVLYALFCFADSSFSNNKFNFVKLKLLNGKSISVNTNLTDATSTTTPETTTFKKSIDSIVFDKRYIEDLFETEVNKILNEGPTNRFWHSFSFADVLPKQNIKSNRSFSSNNNKHMFGKRIKTRQINTQPTNIIGPSPLSISAMVQIGSQSSPQARTIDALSTVGLQVSQKIADQIKSDTNPVSNPTSVLSNIQAPAGLCPFKSNQFCNGADRFSTLDGSCNNLQSTWFGKAETPYKRYMSASYDDGINEPRTKSVSGNPLPNPRTISRTLFNDNSQTDPTFSHMVAAFGQFLAHDITSASLSTGKYYLN